MSSTERRCFVTVGSTLFDELVHAVVGDADVLAALQSLQVTELRVQCGAGTIPKGFRREEKDGDGDVWRGQRGQIKVGKLEAGSKRMLLAMMKLMNQIRRI